MENVTQKEPREELTVAASIERMTPQPPMAEDLAAFLALHEPVGTDEGVWWEGEVRTQIDSYLTADPPPIGYVTSVRSVVFRGDTVLTMRNSDGWHVLPGGRREPNETLEQTLRREALEEAGLYIQHPVPLGFVHLHHLTPRPSRYPPNFLYPDMVQVVFMSEAGVTDAHAKVADDYEEEAVFRDVEEARSLGLTIDSECFLTGALQVRRDRGEGPRP